MKRIKDFSVMFEALKDIYPDIISGRNAVVNKKSFGSTNPKMVARAIRREEKWLKTAYLTI